MGTIRVGILGATGTVGQRFIAMLDEHPQFVVTALAASDRSQGRAYGDACTWRLPGDIPTRVRSLVVQAPRPPLECDVVFSSLPADVAGETETAFARAGFVVVSNSSAHRLDDSVPLLIPEVNAEHLALLDGRQAGRGRCGFIVTNPNCSTVMLALALCHRVNVVDGHMAAVRVKLSRPAGLAELREAFAGFTGEPQRLGLHTAPVRPILVRDEPDRPQPRLDRDAGRGMSVTVGRIAPDRVLGHRFVVLSHNTIRGAAGAAILNAELLVARGYLAGAAR